MKNNIQLMIDSGAYTFFNSGKNPDPDLLLSYSRFIKRNAEYITSYLSLDDISSAEITDDNYYTLRGFNIDPINTYHKSPDGSPEPIEFLDRMMAEGKTFALGGIAASSKENTEFLQFCAKHIRQYFGKRAKLPVHLLGVVDAKLLQLERWESADATSWSQNAFNSGVVHVPKKVNGHWDYTQSRNVTVSHKSRKSRRLKGHLLEHYEYTERQEILEYFAEQGFGKGESEFDWLASGQKKEPDQKAVWRGIQKNKFEKAFDPGLNNSEYQRAALNARHYIELGKQLDIDIYLSHIPTLTDYTKSLKLANAKHILCSYAFIYRKNKPEKEDEIIRNLFNQLLGRE